MFNLFGGNNLSRSISTVYRVSIQYSIALFTYNSNNTLYRFIIVGDYRFIFINCDFLNRLLSLNQYFTINLISNNSMFCSIISSCHLFFIQNSITFFTNNFNTTSLNSINSISFGYQFSRRLKYRNS